MYPLDLIKTVIQTQLKETDDDDKKDTDDKDKDNTRYHNSLDALRKILRTQGIAGLYKGLGSSLLTTAVQSFTYFYWYSFVRKLWRSIKMRRLMVKQLANSTPEELILGIVAAALGQLFTSPISVISTRQQTSPAKNPTILKTAENIYKTDGVTGFWRGLKVSMVLTVNPSITYATFERLKRTVFRHHVDRLSAHESFLLGVVSKMLATVMTQPLIVSKAILQNHEDAVGTEEEKAEDELRSFQSVLRYLYKQEGVASLWKGILPQLSKGVLVQGFIFMFRDQLNVLFRTVLMYLVVLRSRKRIRS